MEFEIFHGDCLSVLREIEDNTFDSIVTDPPYGISFMSSSWDYQVPSVEIWSECLRVIKPGGYLLSFAGTRTQHRMCVNIEDAGFEIRDMIAWVYGSGLPKSQNVGRAIDKSGGAARMHEQARIEFATEIRLKRETAGISRSTLKEWFPQYGYVTENWERKDNGFRVPSEEAFQTLVDRLGVSEKWRDMVRAEDLRRKTDGVKKDRRGDGTVYGLAHNGASYEASTPEGQQWQGWGTSLKPSLEPITVARKPFKGTVVSNVLEHGVGALNIGACRVPIDPNSDMSQIRTMKRGQRTEDTNGQTWGLSKGGGDVPQVVRPEGRWPANLIHDGSEEVLSRFAEFGERKACTSPSSANPEGKILGGRRSQGNLPMDSGTAARYFYCAKANKKDRGSGNNHPTVKPTELMQYLCRLVTPKGGLVLDPFAGSGSTGKAALLEGFGFVGIEQEEEHAEIARQRCREVAA